MCQHQVPEFPRASQLPSEGFGTAYEKKREGEKDAADDHWTISLWHDPLLSYCLPIVTSVWAAISVRVQQTPHLCHPGSCSFPLNKCLSWADQPVCTESAATHCCPAAMTFDPTVKSYLGGTWTLSGLGCWESALLGLGRCLGAGTGAKMALSLTQVSIPDLLIDPDSIVPLSAAAYRWGPKKDQINFLLKLVSCISLLVLYLFIFCTAKFSYLIRHCHAFLSSFVGTFIFSSSHGH